LTEILMRHGFGVEETAYIVRSELIMRCRRRDLPIPAQQSTPSSESSAA
jgi:hypothetical protein